MNMPSARAIALFALCLFSLGCTGRNANDETKPHHTKYGFTNVYSSDSGHSLDFLKWRWDRMWKNIPPPEAYHFPLARNDADFLRSNREKITLTWIGHATVLVQMEGKNILTDPQFSERASPVQWAGPKRVVAPGLAFEELPPIDVVVISHDHYDSLDDSTVRRLRARPEGDKTHFFVPLGLKSWFEARGVENVTEMDWWDEYREGPLTTVAVPVQHWSRRLFSPRNSTLWTGWAILSDRFRFFFAGDSGYTPHFDEIGKRLGPFDLSAIPVGAYEPRWFMRRHHMSPEEAVKVHRDIRSRKSIAIHWGTFILTDEPLDEPPARLKKEMEARRLPPEAFLVLEHGETVTIEQRGEKMQMPYSRTDR